MKGLTLIKPFINEENKLCYILSFSFFFFFFLSEYVTIKVITKIVATTETICTIVFLGKKRLAKLNTTVHPKASAINSSVNSFFGKLIKAVF